MENKLSTHRLIQIHTLEDDMSARARVAHRAANKALSINNMKAWAYFMKRECKFARIAVRCRARLQVAA